VRRRIAILIVGVLLATGCQPGIDVDILDTTPRPPAPTYSPSVDLPTEDIAAMFLAAVEESNAALAAAEARFPNRTALNDHLVYYAALADAEARFLEQIKAIPWPVDLYDDASNLIEASTVYESRLRFASEVRSMGSLSAASRRVAQANEAVSAASAILRSALGLPEPSG
jgi:hypothetical protein